MITADLADLGGPAAQTFMGGADARGVGLVGGGQTSDAGRSMPPANRSWWGMSEKSDLAEKQDQVCKVCEVFRRPMVGLFLMADRRAAEVCRSLRGLRSTCGDLP